MLHSYLEHFHHFIAQKVYHLHRDSAAFGVVKGAGDVAMQSFPCVFVDVGLERNFQNIVRISFAPRK